MSNVSKADFIEMVKSAAVQSDYVQTGESENEDGKPTVYWGLAWRKIKINGRNEITNCNEYDYQSDRPKSTLSIKPIEDSWDLDFGFDVIGDNASALSADELIDVILQAKPELASASIEDFEELKDYPLAFDPVYTTYSLSVNNHEGPIGKAKEIRENGAVILPSYLKGVTSNELTAWDKITGGNATELEEIKKLISDNLTVITADEGGKGGIVCNDWELRQFGDNPEFFMMTPNIDDIAYKCLNFNNDEWVVDNGLLGLLASIMGVMTYCRKEGALDVGYGERFLEFCEHSIDDATIDDRRAVEFGDALFSFTNNGLAYQLLSSMLRLPVYG